MNTKIKLWLLLFVSILVYTPVYSQTNEEKWVYANYTKKEYSIPMRDGIKLYTVVYAPKDTSSSHPILFNRTPYSCAPYGPNKMSGDLWDYLFPYLQRGYIIVKQDVRGRFMSEGKYENIRPFLVNKSGVEIDEASDSYDTADWLVKHLSHHNGRIGVFGISYPGFYALMAGAANHPAIKAVSPQAPVFNWFVGDDFHHNGAFFLNDAFGFMDVFDQIRNKPTTEWSRSTIAYKGNDYEFFRNKSLKQLTDTHFPNNSRPFWSQMMHHPNYDAWWKERSAVQACGSISAAVLVVGGLFDAEDCYGAWNAYKEIRKQSPQVNCRLVFGPWYHGGWNRDEGDSLGAVRFGSETSMTYRRDIELPFFEHYLRGGGSLDSLAGATVFFSGENQWRRFPCWPVATENTDLFLSSGKSIRMEKPVVGESYTSYVSDPSHPVPYDEVIEQGRSKEYMVNDQRFASLRNDVISFETPVLESEVTVAGSVLADLQVSLSTTDADFVVKVIDVFPDGFSYADRPRKDLGGYQMLVRGEIFRGRFRNSFSQPEAFVPGEITPVKFNLPDIAHTFQKGHRIMVQIQSSWFPLSDMNPQQFVDIYQCSPKDFVKSEIRVYHDRLHPSRIVIPVLESPNSSEK
ncbi:MAG: CocE/NonD family hydrolase [Dysgonamonadaceae bacterium]